MEGLVSGLVKSAAWGVLPVSVKIIASVVYAGTHARETIQTVQWLTSFIPSTRRKPEQSEDPWIWVQEPSRNGDFELG